ncbi:MAG: hypothetical protein HJJLKODD_01148 [Phycisphaerae bacterium]|nr:hypothetical protein [Phycisphaerae bacterium]
MLPADRPLLRNRSFLLLFTAYGISVFGDHLIELALMTEMGIQEGEQTTEVSARILFYFFLPYVLLGPLAGMVADRLPRRAIMITADLIRVAICIAIPWYLQAMHGLHNEWTLLPMLLLGLLACFFNPARQSMVPVIVPDGQLTQANSILNILGPVGSIVSYIVSGWLVDWSANAQPASPWLAPYWANYYGDGLTFALSALFLSLMILPRTTPAIVVSSPLQDIRLGWNYIRRHRYVWQLMIFTATFWTAAGAFSSIVPTIVFKVYKPFALSYDDLGYFRASLGIGMLCGGAVLAMIAEASRAHWNIIVGLLGCGLFIVLFSLAPWPGLALVLGVIVGMCGAWILVSANTMLQRIVPDRLRGRVFGIVDLSNMTGMLLATGLLGMKFIPRLDSHVQTILQVLGGSMMLLGIFLWRHHAGRSVFPVIVSFVKSFNEVYVKFWHRLRREGICTVPVQGACIVTSNHLSQADQSFLVSTSPNRTFGFMIAQEFYRLPIWSYFIRQLGCIPVKRDGSDVAATKEALRRLKNGEALCIFIQGGIPTEQNPREPMDGVATLALRSGAKVVPVHISGVKQRQGILATYLARHCIRVRYGNAVDLTEFGDGRDRQQVQAATQKIWVMIQALAPAGGGGYIEENRG